MKSGDTILARTHAELIRKLLNNKLLYCYKCTYDLNDTTFLWLVCLDDTDNDGHKNKFESEDTIIERFDKQRAKDRRFYHGLKRKYRLVFEKIQTVNGRIYKFHGLYKLDKVEDNEYVRKLKRVSTEYEFEGEQWLQIQ